MSSAGHNQMEHSSSKTAGIAGKEYFSYEYAVIKVVPRVHLSSFVNIGVILLVRNADFLDARVHIDREALACLAENVDAHLLERFVEAYCAVCRGGPEAGPVGVLPPSGRFHWLTSPRSGVLQASVVHPGRCWHPERTLEHLFQMYCGSSAERV